MFFPKRLALRTAFSDKKSFQMIGSYDLYTGYVWRQRMYGEKRKLYLATLLVVFAKLISGVFRKFCRLV